MRAMNAAAASSQAIRAAEKLTTSRFGNAWIAFATAAGVHMIQVNTCDIAVVIVDPRTASVEVAQLFNRFGRATKKDRFSGPR